MPIHSGPPIRGARVTLRFVSEEEIVRAGTDKGADTAVVMRSTFSSRIFSSDPEKRLVLHEILAMPRNKTFYRSVGVGEWQVEEATHQAASDQ